MQDQIQELLAVVDFEKFYREKVEIKSHSNDELKGICPFHEDKVASFCANVKTGLFHCFGCSESGSVFQFIEKLNNVTFSEALKILANFSGFELKNPKEEPPPIDPKLPKKYLEKFLKAEDVLKWIIEKKGLTLNTIRKYKIGWDGNRNTIPIYDEKGVLRNIRRYNQKKPEKMISYRTKKYTYGKSRLYGLDELLKRKNELVTLVEGEWDKLLTSQHGFLSITGTTGAGTFKPEWRRYFVGRDVAIIYDLDPEGRKGAENAARAILDVAATVKNVELPLKGTKDEKDLSDYFLKLGATAEDLQDLIDATPLFVIEPEVPEEEAPKMLKSFIEIDLKENIDKRVQVPLTVSGETSEAFHGVSKFRVDFCKLQITGKCSRCPVDKIFVIHPGEKEFIESCMSTESQVIGFLRYRICSEGQKPRITILEKSTVREFFATQRTKRFFAKIGKIGMDESGAELVERRVYFVSDKLVRPQSYLATGYIRTHPKTQQVCLLVTQLEPIEEEFESFRLNDETKKSLEQIQELTPENIVNILSKEVLFLRHREELILALLLTFCSPLRIHFNQIDIRGWINMIVLGDTATGKCIKGDSLLFTNRGTKRIDELGEFKENQFLPAPQGLKLHSLNSLVKPVKTYKTPESKTIKITTKLGYSIEGTLNHPILALDENNELCFKTLDSLREKDLVGINYGQDCFPELNELQVPSVPDQADSLRKFSLQEFRDISRFMGYLIGDGAIAYSDGRIKFANGNKEIVKDYQRLVERAFGWKVKAVKIKNKKAFRVVFRSDKIRNWLENFGLNRNKSPDKEIPDGILGLDRENIREFLRGLFETDGYVTKRDASIGIGLSSRKLIEQLKIILLNFGILSKTYVLFNKRYKKNYFDLVFRGKYAKIFLNEIGFISSEKMNKAKYILQKQNREYLHWNLSKEFSSLWQKYQAGHPELTYYDLRNGILDFETIRGIINGRKKASRNTLRKFLLLIREFDALPAYKKLFRLLTLENIHWDCIAKIEVDFRKTYDLNIPEGHFFFANGFINHNTSAIARFADYVSIGDMVSGLSSSRTGITYGLKEHKQKGWMIKIGRYPANTRKFVCIDEIQYIKARDVRTLGKAMDEGFITIDRIAEKSLESMTRLIALANPREDGVMDEMMFGCEGLRDLFDKAIIRRFDLALCLSHSDIKTNELNLPNIEIKSERIPAKVLRDLIFWIWTRPSELVEIEKKATKEILSQAVRLSEKFGFAMDVPLVAPGDFANKLARLATAYAALCVSSDKKYERIFVLSEHVKFVSSLIDFIYSGEAFGLKEYAEIYKAKTLLTDYDEIKKALEEIKEKEKHGSGSFDFAEQGSKIEQLLYAFKMHEEIRRRELADEIGSDESTVGRKIQVLSQYNLVETGPRGYKKKPKFIKFLRKLARDPETSLHPDRLVKSDMEG